ncbi:MAG: ATP-binding cassette domain-containing protein [Alistipes sp.]|nr:ATP-binding cassette domain-containing protein [Alistipes sp.]
MQHTSIITLRNVGVNYEQSIALEDVNLDIFEDDFIGIIGPNGGGKTSLVKAIMGVVPHSGEIEFAPALRRKNHLKIGYMPQVSQFDTRFPISIEEVVLSGLQSEKGFFGRYTHADRQRATELLKQMGIDQIASRPIGEVSGGQLQRALLCRAIIAEPKLLILDEPTNFVDNNFEREFYALVKQLHERMAVMIVSHDVGTITSLVNAIICVNRHVHRHDSNILTEEQLLNYDCPIQVVSHGHIPHTVLEHHTGDGCKHH